MKSTPNASTELPILQFRGSAEWEAWLAANHAQSRGIWLQIARTSSGAAPVSYAEALEVALCYGWIDGQKKSYDEATWLQQFTPRGARSIWSKVNRAKAEKLIRAGRMQPAGLQAIQRAQENGQWEKAYDSPGQASVPADLQAALDEKPEAKTFFATLDSRNRYAILHRLQTAQKAETRARRLEQFIRMLAQHEKLYPN